MHDQVLTRLFARFQAYTDLADTLNDDLLQQKPDLPKHKSLAEHLWCVIGARESYARAIAQGTWDGFACSLQQFDVAELQAKLASSSAAVRDTVAAVSDWSPERSELLLTLAEHEVMHEGQIIRHLYALERTLPASWTWA